VRRDQSGFTLIEIVVVVLIIGILSSIAVVNFNGVRDKAEAARIATQLHCVEDAVIETISSGATLADLAKIDAPNVATSVLSDYITVANLTDIPDWMSFQITASLVGAVGIGNFEVWIEQDSDASHAAMMPKTINHSGNAERVTVDSRDLAVEEALVTS
jgi:prepilin-type N-terminal cleavage/methylation domain-containing protein